MKKILALTIAVLFLLSVAACSSGNGPGNTAGVFEPDVDDPFTSPRTETDGGTGTDGTGDDGTGDDGTGDDETGDDPWDDGDDETGDDETDDDPWANGDDEAGDDEAGDDENVDGF